MKGQELCRNSGGRRRLSVAVERWPLKETFTIARGSKREAIVVVASIGDGVHAGRGECVPYARYGESVETVVSAIEGCAEAIAKGMSRLDLLGILPAGAARNAIDCALWDIEAKASGKLAFELAGLEALQPRATALTISLASPEEMAARALATSDHPLLKLKLGGAEDVERLRAVRGAVPRARLIADANEAWVADDLEPLLAVAAETNIELVEQPLPAGQDEALSRVRHTVPICADESVHDRASLAELKGRYDAVNIKLDKTGGLTEALLTARDARLLGLKIMVGCMVATSLAMAPALLIAQDAEWVDLDGPLLLAHDRDPGLAYAAGQVYPPTPALWG